MYNNNSLKQKLNTICIKLNYGEFLDSKIIRLQKDWTIRFVCGKKLLGKKIKLQIVDNDITFIFKKLIKLEELDINNSFDYQCSEFGSFFYEFFLLNDETDIEVLVGRGFFSVIPSWKIANSLKNLSLNSLSIITHITKLLGPLIEWEDRLRVAKMAGYNVIHLTPVQVLGISGSSYSIADFQQLNPIFKANFSDLEKFVKKIEQNWEVLTIQDVVWNHTAKNATWLWEHPESSYNCYNSPHLIPAFILDRALHYFSLDLAKGKYKNQNLLSTISNDQHINILKNILNNEIISSLKLHEFFQVDVEKMLSLFRQKILLCKNNCSVNYDYAEIKIIQDPNYKRFGCSVDINKSVETFNKNWENLISYEEKITKCCDEFRKFLINLNQQTYEKIQSYCQCAINAIISHVYYERVSDSGLKKGKITINCPLVSNYFCVPKYNEENWEDDEKRAYDPKYSVYFMACNGWVMNADPLINFAETPSQTYLKRELICWGDCIKLNYGQKPADSPFLWNYMQDYTEKCANVFHGFRIDNCHSTPMHVAQHFLKAARKIKPNLYVIAELFTGSEEIDNLFVNKLGITSLVRECQNAPNSHEQGRFVYRYSGDAVGTFRSKLVRPATSGVAHAMLCDQTHDNPTPFQKRTVYDYVPTAAMTAMAFCASGSVRGYDEFVPYHIDVVHENRFYNTWTEICKNSNLKGMINARCLLNNLHAKLAETGYNEIFVDQINPDIVAITRHNPISHKSVLLIAHCCFSTFKWTAENARNITVDGKIEKILFEMKTIDESKADTKNPFYNDNRIFGLLNFHVEIQENVLLNNSLTVDITSDNIINLRNFPSGSVIAFKIKPKIEAQKACIEIENIVNKNDLQKELSKELFKLELNLFNYILFCSEKEEYATYKTSSYNIPHYGKLVYCGLQGFYSVLKIIQETNDLGHPLCTNLREGKWICNYIIDRLMRKTVLQSIGNIFKTVFDLLDNFSAYNDFLPQVEITEQLSISSIAFLSAINGANLPPIVGNNDLQNVPSLSAGLPHFAEGIWRNWGRDTFISLTGVLLLNGRFRESRDIILAFAGTLRHGLIPNLLAEGKSPRYNCRDAVWFWLASIFQYINLVPKGYDILSAQVLRLYPTDNSEYLEEKKIEPLHATMYEAIQRHFNGIQFRERNAGVQIDEHMKDEGFNIKCYVDKTTGFVFGGNEWNCGTWMDKMGSSDKAGNRGYPATPRDGAAVEIQGLTFFVMNKLSKLSFQNFPYLTVKDNDVEWTWSDWANNLRKSFLRYFFVDEKCNDEFVNRRCIIKDSYKSSFKYTDFQLRPNFCIALKYAPTILDPELSWQALETAKKILKAPLGICTLDPTDYAYNGYYYNNDDSANKQIAKGWNYHQGPEWLWIAAEYLTAKLKVAYLLSKKNNDFKFWQTAVNEVLQKIFVYSTHMKDNVWSSLPELTNKNGKLCQDSCQAQAWSIGCFIETIHTFYKLNKEIYN